MEYKNVYFLGIGGIGMSALARYFLHGGYAVAGYDRTPSHLTGELEAEGAAVHYEDDVRLIPEGFLDPKKTMVVYTPAVPQDHGEYRYFREHGFCVEKRSQMLGHLAEGKYVMAVAGTHGKTTTSTMVAWLNRALTGGGSAFLGGISKNFGGNLVLGDGGRLAVEADEFDRSFLRLYPDVAASPTPSRRSPASTPRSRATRFTAATSPCCPTSRPTWSMPSKATPTPTARSGAGTYARPTCSSKRFMPPSTR